MKSSYVTTPHSQHNPHYPRTQFNLQPKDIFLRSDRETAVHRKSLDLFHSGQIMVQHIFLTRSLPAIGLHALLDGTPHADSTLPRRPLPP
jgi:hypothetical protein